MKLFKSLLVAPAAIGLLAPLAANATEVNFNDISNYSDEEIEINSKTFENEPASNLLLAGGEGMVDSFDGGFSETTTASFSVDFGVGAVDGLGVDTGTTDNVTEEGVFAVYGFQIDLNTSFTGEDSLDVSIDAGNATSAATSPEAEFDLNGTTNALTIDGVSYSFPLGPVAAFVGMQGTDGSSAFTTACTYGGPSNTLDDCGNVNSGFGAQSGSSFGGSYSLSDEWTIAAGYAGNGTTDTAGLMSAEGADAYGVNTAYTTDSWGLSATYSVVEQANAIYADTHLAVNGFFAPEQFPGSFSVGYEWNTLGGVGPATDESTSYFIGVQIDELGPGSAGIAMGTVGSMGEALAEDQMMYEAYYAYPLNDGMTITPLIFSKEGATATDEDQTGLMVKTSFSF